MVIANKMKLHVKNCYKRCKQPYTHIHRRCVININQIPNKKNTHTDENIIAILMSSYIQLDNFAIYMKSLGENRALVYKSLMQKLFEHVSILVVLLEYRFLTIILSILLQKFFCRRLNKKKMFYIFYRFRSMSMLSNLYGACKDLHGTFG